MKIKSILTIILLLFLSAKLLAQSFPVAVLKSNGPDENRVNFAILADGYTAGEETTFVSNANTVLSSVFAQTPYAQYESFFNVYGIQVTSIQSGADHPRNTSDSDCASVPAMSVNNYFGSAFDSYGIHRLLVASNESAMNSVLASNVPSYDQAVVLVNTPYYGGAGGTFATFSMHSNAPGLMIHEVGHSFAFLADEYWAGTQYITTNMQRPNFSNNNNPSSVKWSNWSGSNGISTYSHTYPGYYKPHQNCKMQYLAGNFCSVCIEAHIDKIYSLVTPIDAKLPNTANVTYDGNPLDFSLNLNRPNPNTLDIKWTLNNISVGTEDSDTLTLTSNEITEDNMTLTATVTDETDLSRHMNSGDYVFTVSWNISNTTLSTTDIEPVIHRFFYKVYPTPTEDNLFISYTTSKAQEIELRIYDLQGKEIMKKNTVTTFGEGVVKLDVQTLQSGIYLVKMTSNTFNRSFKFTKK